MTDNFDKLVKNYGKSPEAVKKKDATRRVHQRFLWASLGAFALTVATGGIGAVLLVPVLIAWMYYAGREWMG